MKKLLGLFSLALLLPGCQVSEVAPVTADRYEACEVGYECSLSCDLPMNALEDLGCGPGDFNSLPPNCALEDDCANAKSNCYASCEDSFPAADGAAPQEQVDCKIECSADYGNDSSCKTDFQNWLVEREAVLQPYRTCLSPCEGRPTRVTCDSTDDERCNTVMYARHLGVEMVEQCILGDDDACAWRCDDPLYGFPVPAE